MNEVNKVHIEKTAGKFQAVISYADGSDLMSPSFNTLLEANNWVRQKTEPKTDGQAS